MWAHKCLGAGLSLSTIPLQIVVGEKKKKRGLPELSAEHNLFFFFPPFLHGFIPGL